MDNCWPEGKAHPPTVPTTATSKMRTFPYGTFSAAEAEIHIESTGLGSDKDCYAPAAYSFSFT